VPDISRAVGVTAFKEGGSERWTNAFFADHRLFTLYAAYEDARHSR
jgi:hypothetical protein